MLPGDAEAGLGGALGAGGSAEAVRAEAEAAGTTQLVYRERFALLRQWLVCLHVRVGAAVCPWAGLAVCPWKTDLMADTQLGPTQSSSDPV